MLPPPSPTPLAVLSPAQDEFRFNNPMPTERFRAAAVNVTEHVYLFGGRDVAGSLVRVFVPFSCTAVIYRGTGRDNSKHRWLGTTSEVHDSGLAISVLEGS